MKIIEQILSTKLLVWYFLLIFFSPSQTFSNFSFISHFLLLFSPITILLFFLIMKSGQYTKRKEGMNTKIESEEKEERKGLNIWERKSKIKRKRQILFGSAELWHFL